MSLRPNPTRPVPKEPMRVVFGNGNGWVSALAGNVGNDRERREPICARRLDDQQKRRGDEPRLADRQVAAAVRARMD